LRARQPSAVQSALTVLEAVAEHGPGVTAKQIMESLALARATTYRLLNLLVQDGYLVRTPDLGGFALGSKVVQLALSARPALPPKAARDILQQLRDGVRGGVHLVRYADARVILVDEDPDYPLNDPARIRSELDSSAFGRLLLAELGALGYPAWNVRASSRSLETIIDETRRQGFGRQIGQFEPGKGCLVVPIRDEGGALVAGVGLAARSERVERPGDLLLQLRDAASRLAPLLA
jgi:DNA-binding IclR family transcriptional regulator